MANDPDPTPDPTRTRASVAHVRPVVIGALAVSVLALLGLRMSGADIDQLGSVSSAASARQGSAPGDVDASDGRIGDRLVTAFDDEPAVTRLDPALLAAVRDATRAAAAEDIEVRVTSGWRSTDFQRQLFDEAVRTYGSAAEARRWVNTPERSTHVTGDAVDIGPTDAAYWIAQHGSDYGLCQVYANEIWHYELLTSPGGTCPPPRADGGS